MSEAVPVGDDVLHGAATGSRMFDHEIESAAAELIAARAELPLLRAVAEAAREYHAEMDRSGGASPGAVLRALEELDAGRRTTA